MICPQKVGRVDNIPQHPAQLYESLDYFLIFGITFLLYKTKRKYLENRALFGLALVLIFSALFFFFFFFFEFQKERQVAFEEGMKLDMGQLLSIPYVVAGIVFFIYGICKTKRKLVVDR